MDEELIRRWNEVVNHSDQVYVLGDFSFYGKEKTREILSRLKGRKYLCLGSHDKQIGRLTPAFPGDDKYPREERFEQVRESYTITLQDSRWGAVRFFLSHYCHKVWPKSHYGVAHLFGHSHGALDDYAKGEGKLLDVGVDTNDFYPYSIDQVMSILSTRPSNFNLVRDCFVC